MLDDGPQHRGADRYRSVSEQYASMAVTVARRIRQWPLSLVAIGVLLWHVPLYGAGSQIVEAAKAADWAAVRAQASRRNVNTTAADGTTALLWAAQWDDTPIATFLIRLGASVNMANDYGVTPVSMAALNGNAPMLTLLLTHGANANAERVNGETPLMLAARTGRLDAVATLVNYGADVNHAERVLGQTPLMWALSERHTEVARYLVEHGADPQKQSTNGFSPIMFATRQNDLEAVRFLLRHGATANDTARDGTSLLHMAIVRGHIELADFLLDNGANPNAEGPGYTPLHWAAGTWETATSRDYSIREWGNLPGLKPSDKLRVIKALFTHGALPNPRATKTIPRFGSSAWHIQNGGSPIGATPFFYAAMSADLEVMQLLLANGADPLLGTHDRTTPLLAAAGLAVEESETSVPEQRHLEAVKLLLDLGADISASNGQGDTVLHAAAFVGYNAIAQFLFDRGAPLNLKNKAGQTPYKIASGIMVTMMFFQHPSTAALLKNLGGVE